MNNKSLEEVVHEIISEHDDTVPLFKHITTRWNHREQEMGYEVCVAASLLSEARTRLLGLRNELLKKYGSDVRKHFREVYRNSNENEQQRKRNYMTAYSDWDDEMGNFIKRSSGNDMLSKVLIEGMEKLHETENRGAIVFNQLEKKNRTNEKEDKGNNEGNSSPDEKRDIIEIQSSHEDESDNESDSTLSNGEVIKKAWEEMSFKGEYEKCIPATENQKRITFNTLDEKGLTFHDVERWKNKNWVKIPAILHKCENSKYEALKKIVRELMKERLKDENEKQEHTETERTQRTNHPETSKSLPEEMGEGQGV